MGTESLTIRPPAPSWASLLRRTPVDPASRRALGLPTDRPIIMTGHQPDFWHPGILAKYLATHAACRALNADPAWLVVDQERPSHIDLRFPAQRPDGSWHAISTALDAHDIPTLDAPGTPAQVRVGLSLIHEAWARHEESNTSRRVAAALSDLISPYIPPAPTIFASDLHRTPIMADLLARMAADPEACVNAYNAAVAAHPSAGIRPLIANPIQDRFELPLWHLPPGLPRRHVHAEDLAGIPPAHLAPKALLMTAIARLALCDIFIHGTGGGGDSEAAHDGYDLITDQWLTTWLGSAGSSPPSLAPVAVVTATLHLPLTADPPPTPADIARATWHAHHARHEPAAIGDFPSAARKFTLLASIRAASRLEPSAAAARIERRRLFRELHDLLADARGAHAAELQALLDHAAALRARRADADILTDRTWPFPLYPADMLRSLQAAVEAAF
ncbi:MAG: hypothetical protein ACKVW3_14730 [Phycisphaerales bacterium]